MDSNRTPDLSKLSRLSRSPLAASTGAPDLSKLSILSRNSNASDANKLARLGERSTNFSRRLPHLKNSPSPSPFSQHAGATRMYVHYTISEDRSGSVDEVMAQRLKALSRREKKKKVKESPWLQCLWAGCRDSWHRGRLGLAFHVDRHVESMGRHLFCLWQGCGNKDLPFSSRFLLREHVAVHTGQRSHPCIHCKKSFDQAEDLDTHVSIAHGSFRDGRIVINAGAGSRVGVSKFPLAEDDAELGALDLRVLVVDEDATSRDDLRRKLNREGIHNITLPTDTHDALTKLLIEKTSGHRHPFDIVFVDTVIAYMYNPRVTQDIRMVGWEVPIIGLTTSRYNKEDCSRAGVRDFLARPIRREALRNLLKRYFPGA